MKTDEKGKKLANDILDYEAPVDAPQNLFRED